MDFSSLWLQICTSYLYWVIHNDVSHCCLNQFSRNLSELHYLCCLVDAESYLPDVSTDATDDSRRCEGMVWFNIPIIGHFENDFSGSDDPTNSVAALTDDG